MNIFLRMTTSVLLCLHTMNLFAASDNTQLSVWVNEAIVATYTYDYQDFLNQQKHIAKYFTADGWIAYSAALQTSGLPEQIQKNSWKISAVATMPPEVNMINATNWKADMPTLIVYKNKQSAQKQIVNVSITFTTAPKGIRGYAITSINTEIIKQPCSCDLREIPDTRASETKTD